MVVMTHHDNHKTWGEGQLMGLTNSIYLDDLIKYTCSLWYDTDEDRETINGSIQYLKQLPNSWQIIGASSKPIFMSLEALQ